jgi:alkylation response protein AidB-like acyl-CoA dehydrogenase
VTLRDLRAELERFARGEAPDLPLPGRGRTPDRLGYLVALGRRDLSVARLCEAHADALAILADADRAPTPGATYGVWAARTRDEVLTARRDPEGWRVAGTKPWCTGVGLVSHALVTAEADAGPLLVELELDGPGVEVAATPWVAPAFAATSTATLTVDVTVQPKQVVGAVGSYLERPGFWHGASGVAACWAGGVAGLVDRAATWWRGDDHAAAHRGAVDALAWSVVELVAAAGRDADAAPDDGAGAHRTALRLRHLVDAAAGEALTRVRRGCGPAPFAFDADLGRHAAELELYVRQCHAERDLAVLGRVTTGP